MDRDGSFHQNPLMNRLALLLAVVAATSLTASAVLAAPGVTVRYFDGVAQIQLEGDYPLMRYTVWRAESADGPFATAITGQSTLCIGACFADDRTAEPGHTYWYRFDLEAQDGSQTSYGPYPILILGTRVLEPRVGVFPNPGSGAARVELRLPGKWAEGPLPATVTFHDLQGRVLRTLHRGPLARGLTSVAWDGRGADGRRLEPGCYFVRFATPLGSATARVLRIR